MARFLILVHIFRLFSILLEKKMPVILNKRECPLPKNALSKVWLILSQWLWRREFKNFVNVILLFYYYLLVEKGMTIFLTHLFPFTNGFFVPNVVVISPAVLDKKTKIWIAYDNEDDGHILIREIHLSLQMR